MSEVASSLESLDQRGNGVRVDFTKRGDRFGHEIYAVGGGKADRVFLSDEGSESEANPATPPFQELHCQGNMLFLTGATTLGHWSMSVGEVLVAEDELSRRLFDKRYGLNEPPKHPKQRSYVAFEVACRLKSEHDRLGSSYVKLYNGTTTCDGDNVLTKDTTPALIFGSVALSESRECTVRVTEGDLVEPRRFQIGPTHVVEQSFPCTVQWRYGIYWV